MVRNLGFFCELEHGQRDGPSLIQSRRPTAEASEDRIVRYLEEGEVVTVMPGVARDILDPKKPIICAPHIRSDGEWQWPGDLAYYVRRYHVRLPEDFIHRVLTRGTPETTASAPADQVPP